MNEVDAPTLGMLITSRALSRANSAFTNAQMHASRHVQMMSPTSSCHPPFPHPAYCRDSHCQSPSNGHLKMAGRYSHMQAPPQYVLVPFRRHCSPLSSITRSSVNLILKSLMNTCLCIPINSFALSLYYLRKIPEHFSISLARNKVPVLSKKYE